MATLTTPRSIAHIGVSVPDLDAAVTWYQEILGFRLIGPPGEVDLSDGSHFAHVCTDIFGTRCKRLRLAHISTANGTALELFQFVDPINEPPQDNFEYWRSGIFHFCVIDPDVNGLADRIASSGGKIRSKVWDLFDDGKYQIVYCEDPFGTIVEIYSHSHEQLFANQG